MKHKEDRDTPTAIHKIRMILYSAGLGQNLVYEDGGVGWQKVEGTISFLLHVLGPCLNSRDHAKIGGKYLGVDGPHPTLCGCLIGGNYV